MSWKHPALGVSLDVLQRGNEVQIIIKCRDHREAAQVWNDVINKLETGQPLYVGDPRMTGGTKQ